jgi:ABC-2 type transport system ATP-binding protein
VNGEAGARFLSWTYVNAIDTDRLSKHYGRRVGVETLSLAVGEGCLFGFLGPNGSGKTTTIRLLMGLLRADGGRAKIFGKDCWRQGRRLRAEIGYLPGDLRLYPSLNCRSALRIFGAARRRDLAAAGAELAEAFGLDPLVPVRKMSRGMVQKLGLVLALAHRPRLLILDEPTASLDPLVQETLYRRLRLLVDSGCTVFFSSHTLGEVERLCDQVAILRDGRLAIADSLDALRARAARVVTIRWQLDAGIPAVPSFLTIDQRSERLWHATLVGPVMDLVRWSAGQAIEDLTIGLPDLGRLFQQFYAAEPSA